MNKTIDDILNRRSTKSFKGTHLDSLLIDEIIDCGLKAPSGMNKQSPIILKITNDEVVNTLRKLNLEAMNINLTDYDPFYNAKDILVVLASKDVPTYLYDGSLVMGNLLLASFAKNVGACWIHRAKEAFETPFGIEILNNAGIKGNYEGIGFCVLGIEDKPKEVAKVLPNRVFEIK